MAGVGKNIRALRISKKMTQDDLAGKLFVSRQTVSNYETGKSKPDIEMLVKIAEVLETDPNSLIYGIPKTSGRRKEFVRFGVGAGILAVLVLANLILSPIAGRIGRYYFIAGPSMVLKMVLRPCIFLTAGWVLMQLIILAFGPVPLQKKYAKWLRRVAIGAVAAYFVIIGPSMIGITVSSISSYINMKNRTDLNWTIGMPFSAWNAIAGKLFVFILSCSGEIVFLIPGAVLRVTGRENTAGKGRKAAEKSDEPQPEQCKSK